jgi:hypothetical protein
LKRLIPVLCIAIFGLFHLSASGQEVEAAFGLGTVTAPSAADASGNYTAQSLTGGLYPSFSANFILKRRLGFGGEVAWRASRNLYFASIPYRPLFYDFNAVWAPHLANKTTAELMAGIGAESLRIYQGFTSCGFTGCTNYTSSNHFLGHFGGGLRMNVWGNFFVRPEAHLYLIRNNTDFSSGRVTRFGVSLGYTFAPPQY